ncbi:Tellurite resistance protein TehB [Garciella nitratireducens DSM 15102]|uniref:Tellurite resistance protein TehB n=1 Tax=Garciella nitratireducens DSM 15102 TaxID=1121911 RepID=A0A1T4NGE9_9FIRM|nr:Tellurite resistance protein TehB [Garciella nitratireducens DSM 15102]
MDIGCGIGGFSIAFAKSGFYVTAIDSSMIAMEHLRNKIQEINLQNIKIFPVSLEDFQFFQKYDVIFGSYIMGLMEEKMIDRVLEYTTHYLILLLPYRRIKNDFCIEELYRELKIDTDYLKQSNYLDLIKILDRKNISYHIKILHSDFGQPFQTKEEGLDFINHYFPILKKYDDEVMKWLDRKCILRDGKYYLPNQKESVIMIIEKKGRI